MHVVDVLTAIRHCSDTKTKITLETTRDGPEDIGLTAALVVLA
ncbi:MULTISPECIES: hypothetical protein [unclassified Marinovum]